jgi:hypothetical protein
MRSFSVFDAALPADLVRQAGADRLRSLAIWAYQLLRPGPAVADGSWTPPAVIRR